MSTNPSALDPGTPSTGSGRQRLRILAVDDDQNVRNLIKAHLEEDGHEVHTAENGVVGLKRFMGEDWDVVITDRYMPRMDGDELAEAIKRINPRTPVILVTGYADALPDPNRQQSPFDLVLHKPFSRANLLAAVAAACFYEGGEGRQQGR